ncbi:hypothetical protein ACBR55_11995 [Salinicoccus roseus]|uniref:hypothetical protein n=1 Tax=Salinicoccus roseus TaxID=45670 RepID=UPI003525C57C
MFNTVKRFYILEVLGEVSYTGVKFDQTAVPILFEDVKNKRILKNDNIYPFLFTQDNLKTLMKTQEKYGLQIVSVATEDEEISKSLTASLNNGDCIELEEIFNEMVVNELEVDKLVITLEDEAKYTLQKTGIISIHYNDEKKVESLLSEEFLLDVMGVGTV